MPYFLFLCLTILIIILDLGSKTIFQNILQLQDIIIWKSFIFTLQFNQGIAFSLPLTGFLQIMISITVLVAFFFYYQKKPYWTFPLFQIALAFIFGGALGNLYERIFYGQVTDFIQVFSWFPVFNLADSFIFTGVVLLIIFENKISQKITDKN